MKYNYLLLCIFGMAVQVSFGGTEADSVRLERSGNTYFVIHQIDPGETLFSLSRRYNSEIEEIKATNSLTGNTLEVGQVLKIPYKNPQSSSENTHVVTSGETLFSISQLYEVEVENLKKWNNLKTNEISIGQSLVISDEATTEEKNLIVPAENSLKEEKPMYTYYVRTGETLASIAGKFEVPEDSIIAWNRLSSRKLALGQALIFPFELPEDSIDKVNEVSRYNNTRYGSKLKSNEEGGVAKVVEEGLAKMIDEDLNTTKYLALHRSLRIGTVFQVKNLMNNERIYVRVVGKLPDTGINKNVMIRLTPISFEKLGILDEKALVEITYFKQ